MRLEKDETLSFTPLIIEIEQFLKTATEPFLIAIENDNGVNYRFDFKTSFDFNRTVFLTERIIKSLLWIVGGYRVYLFGNSEICKLMKNTFSHFGKRSFDVTFMEKIYGKPFAVEICNYDNFPIVNKHGKNYGGFIKGCRIGLNLGGSDYKIAAVKNGKEVYSEEVEWQPKMNPSPRYHYQVIKEAIKKACSYLPHTDCLGISSCGVIVDNKIMCSSLFKKAMSEENMKFINNIFINIAKELGICSLAVLNDGDVAALEGHLELRIDNLLGIAMGSSQAGGFINLDGKIDGWLNELSFVPIEIGKEAALDEWSLDYGCGGNYLSQEGLARIIERQGISISGTPAQKLSEIQKLVLEGNQTVINAYQEVGRHLGYSIAYYHLFYQMKNVFLMGPVTTGIGGDLIKSSAEIILKDVFPHLKNINILLPNEKQRRIGQAFAAATLPK